MRRFALVVIVMTLAVRALVPAGWMPSGEQAFALTVCTGFDTETVWLDKHGKVHKSKPEGTDTSDHDPCVFAGPAAFANAPSVSIPMPLQPGASSQPTGFGVAAIGLGLAAPPPPATGPPILI